jgi:hypothetical protein
MGQKKDKGIADKKTTDANREDARHKQIASRPKLRNQFAHITHAQHS